MNSKNTVLSTNSIRYRAREFVPDEGPWDPFSGAAGALMGTATSMMMGVADMPIQTLKLLQIHPDSKSKKGKEKSGTVTEASSTGEETRSGRPEASRTTTNATDASAASGSSTPPTPITSTNLTRAQSETVAVTSPDTPGTPTHRSTFMSQAFGESTGGSRSPSRDRGRHLSPSNCEIADRLTHRRRASSISASELRSNNGTPANAPSFAENVESVVDTGKGLARIVGAGFKSPMDFSLNVAKGFHNVPKLYGGEVRQVDKVTDLQSGLRTAAKVYQYVIY